MKQVFQDARSAEVTVVEVPAPKLLAGWRAHAKRCAAGVKRTVNVCDSPGAALTSRKCRRDALLAMVWVAGRFLLSRRRWGRSRPFPPSG